MQFAHWIDRKKTRTLYTSTWRFLLGNALQKILCQRFSFMSSKKSFFRPTKLVQSDQLVAQNYLITNESVLFSLPRVVQQPKHAERQPSKTGFWFCFKMAAQKPFSVHIDLPTSKTWRYCSRSSPHDHSNVFMTSGDEETFANGAGTNCIIGSFGKGTRIA